MKAKDIFIVVGLIVVLVVGVNFPMNGTTVVKEITNTVGATAGPNYTEHQVFSGGLTDGGGVQIISPTSGSHTLTRGQMDNAKVITFVASTTMPAFTVTTPASTTFPLFKAGEYRTWVIENPFLAAATTTTIAAGAGVDLQEPDGQNVVIGINSYAFLTCFREASTNVVCSVDETIPAD
jgi:hypothetical protein